MRFRRRDLSHKASAAPVLDDVPFFNNRPDPTGADDSIEQRQKAERILGISQPQSKSKSKSKSKSQSQSQRQSSLVTPNNARQRAPQLAVSAEGTGGSDLWSTHGEQEYQPMDNARSANGGLKPWPKLQSNNSHASLLTPPVGWTPPVHPASHEASYRANVSHETSDSTLRSHYQASQQPLAVSQQTSSSAAREMGLRKVMPSVTSRGNDVDRTGRPLKSALKNHSQEPDTHLERPGSKKEGGLRMQKFANFMSGRHTSNQSHLQSSQLSHSGSSLSLASAAPSNTRSPSSSHNASSASRSVTTDPTVRPKVFESDVFDSNKLNVRRPPKGITNWFDGVDISSDEEEIATSDALPSNFSSYKDESRQATRQHDPHSSDQTYGYNIRNGHPEPQPRRSSRQPTRPIQNLQRNISDNFVEENALAIDLARRRMQSNQQKPHASSSRSRRDSGDSHAPSSMSHANSIMSGAYGGMSDYSSMLKRDGNTRVHPRLGDDSVLSLSENSDDELPPHNIRGSLAASSRYTADIDEASVMRVERPYIAPRPYLSKWATTRDSSLTTATMQTSGSIPIHWNNESPVPVPPLPRRVTGDSMVDHTSEALRRLIGRENSVRTQQSRPISSRYESEDGSVAGETVDSLPSDISRMMAVTEEEMALLEMMRLKRAAMQQGNISEGAQQLLKREQELLMAKQKSAQKIAQKLLRAKDDRSRERAGEWAQDLRPEYDGMTGLSSLREEDVDDQLRIERFLASETPLEDVFPFPDPPTRSRASSIPREPAPLEDLLLPRTYTPQPDTQRSQLKSTSPKPPARARAPSTISGASEFDANESAQLEAEMRQFLGGDEFAESSAFPMPPKSGGSSRRSSRRVTPRTTNRTPVLPSTREEESTPQIPARSRNRMPSFGDENVLPPSDRTAHRLRPDSDALNFFPPPSAALPHPPLPRRYPEPPTPSDTSERVSTFLGPTFEASFDTMDANPPTSAGTSLSQSSNNLRFDSPSLSTSQPSPLTPTFPAPLVPSERHRPIHIATNDASYHHHQNAYDDKSLRTANSSTRSASSQSQSHSQSHSQTRRKPKPIPQQLDTLSPATFNPARRMSSNGSCASASDDVMAAWAELGGVSESVGGVSRSRSPMYSR